MSWSKNAGLSRRIVGMAVVIGAAFMLAGCLRPLYGGPAGGDLKASLASIEVDPIPDRIGHYLRNELAFDLDGSGEGKAKKYRLTVKVTERIASPVVDTVAGRSQAGVLTADANFVLRSLSGEAIILEGNATAFASYDRTTQRFASLRAAREAEIRVATQLAEQIRNRIAATLANR